MIEFLYIPIILLLYFRTVGYCLLIDDNVPRDGYLYVVTEENPKIEFYQQRRS